MERRRSAAVQRDVVCFFLNNAQSVSDRPRYAWLNSMEIRARRLEIAATEKAAATARASHLASLQNGDHAIFPSGGQPRMPKPSPNSTSHFSAAVSSVRDEPAQPVIPVNMEEAFSAASGVPISPSDGNERDAIAQIIESEISSTVWPLVHENNPAVPADSDSTTIDAKRVLAHRLFEAALTRSESVPPPLEPELKTIPPNSKSLLPPKSLSIKDMIKLKMLPIDFAVNAAWLAMGEGADEDEMDLAIGPMVLTAAALEERDVSTSGEGLEAMPAEINSGGETAAADGL